MSRLRLLLAAVAAALLTAGPSQAAFTVTFTSGFGSTSVGPTPSPGTAAIAGFTQGANDEISYSSASGLPFRVSSNAPGTPTLGSITLGEDTPAGRRFIVSNNTNTAQTVTVTITDTTLFNSPVTPSGYLVSTLRILNQDTSSSLNLTSSIDNPAISSSLTVNGGVNSITTFSNSVFFTGAGPRHMSATYTLNLAAGTLTTFSGESQLLSTPAPATALMALCGMPMLGAFGYLRRRKTVAA